jgi:ribose transport system substrate-binding protein
VKFKFKDAFQAHNGRSPALVLAGALVMLLVVAACAAPVALPTSAPPTSAPAATDAPAATSAPAATTASGSGTTTTLADKKVGLSSPFEVEILNEFYADMRKEGDLPENQVKMDIVQAGGDPVKQSADLEAFLAQGYDGIFFLAAAPGGLDDFVKRATDQGVCVFNHSASPVTGATQNVVLDQHASGYEVGRVAAEWINERGGDLEVAFLVNTEDPNLQARSQGEIDAIKELAPNAKIVGEAEANTIELGAAGTANLLQANPNISVILAFSDDGGLGAYQAATEAGKTDPDTFFIGSADGTQLVLDRIEEGGIYQATWSYLFPFSSVQWMRDMEKCLRGEEVPPTRTQLGRIVTLENLAEVRTMVSDPLNPSVQKFYDDPAVMRYSDEPLMTPQ